MAIHNSMTLQILLKQNTMFREKSKFSEYINTIYSHTSTFEMCRIYIKIECLYINLLTHIITPFQNRYQYLYI